MSAQVSTAPTVGTQGFSRNERWRRRGPLLPALVFTIVVTQIRVKGV